LLHIVPVGKLNVSEIEDIVKLGLSLGVKEFQIFPQKGCGRAANNLGLLLDNDECAKYLQICPYLASKYNVSVEYLREDAGCGSGYSGFAINEKADVFPCIFGVEDQTQCIGNILQDDVEHFWFNSPKMNYFRTLCNSQPCKRCERSYE